MSSSAQLRNSYHHGDLRNALIGAAADLAGNGGPDAVTIRAAARAVGVTPTAAYRHFAGQQDLLQAARDMALTRLMDAMDAELHAMPEIDDRLTRAVGKLAAIGRGYVAFATTEAGLFRTAFSCDGVGMPPDTPGSDGTEFSVNPFQVLADVMDELVDVGYLPAERRPMADLAAWSTAHGVAMLLLEGPLRNADATTREQVVVRTLLTFVEGLGARSISEETMWSLLYRPDDARVEPTQASDDRRSTAHAPR